MALPPGVKRIHAVQRRQARRVAARSRKCPLKSLFPWQRRGVEASPVKLVQARNTRNLTSSTNNWVPCCTHKSGSCDRRGNPG